MAIFTRVNGDAAGQLNVDAGRSFANAAVINTGISAPLTAYKITFAAGTAGNLAAELATGGAVETTIRAVEYNATVLAYQVDAGAAGASQISVLTERSGWATDSALQTALATLGNIGAFSNVYAGTAQVTVSSTGGIKLA
jgi:hypothetical protein